MDIVPEIAGRYSCRSYEDKAVEQDKLDRIFEAARLAPTAKNFQEWRLVVVRDEQTRQALVPACKNQKFVGQAPIIIAGCGVNKDYTMTCGQRSTPIDVTIVLEHVALQAVREGLGTCWIGAFFADQVRDILRVPDEAEIVQLMALGYPADTYRAHPSQSLDELVCYDTWSLAQ